MYYRFLVYTQPLGIPGWLSSKESTCQCRRCRFDPWVRKIPWRRKWWPIPVFLLGKSHGQRSLEGCSPWGPKEVDTASLPTQKHSIALLCSSGTVFREFAVIIQSVSLGARTKLAITPKCLGGGVSIYIPMLALELKNLPDTCMTELFCCPPETVTTLLISYTPI